MKYECNVIEDLLPLYKDEICSPETAKVVEEHMAECPRCSGLLEKLGDTTIDEFITKEKNEVIGSQSRYFKRKSAAIGSVIAAIFAIPILVCLIVNLASGNGLGWFFIVLAAMFIPASLLVVPLMASKNKLFLTLTSFTASIIVLIAVCCIYDGGSWFFMVGSSVLFGLTLCFSPILVNSEPLKEALGNKKGFAAMSAVTITFFLMMVCIGLYAKEAGFFKMAFGISVPLVLIAWLIFFIIRYMPGNGLFKTGAIIAVISIATFVAGKVIGSILTASLADDEVLMYTEPDMVFMIVGAVIGVILMMAGAVTRNTEA